jgi:hypothetical protein
LGVPQGTLSGQGRANRDPTNADLVDSFDDDDDHLHHHHADARQAAHTDNHVNDYDDDAISDLFNNYDDNVHSQAAVTKDDQATKDVTPAVHDHDDDNDKIDCATVTTDYNNNDHYTGTDVCDATHNYTDDDSGNFGGDRDRL